MEQPKGTKKTFYQKYSLALQKVAARTQNTPKPVVLVEEKRPVISQAPIINLQPEPQVTVRVEPKIVPQAEPIIQQTPIKAKIWDFQLISTVAVILFFGVIVVLFSLLKGNIYEKNALRAKLGNIEEALNSNNEKIKSIYTDAKTLDTKITDISSNLDKMNQTYSVQTKALINLTDKKKREDFNEHDLETANLIVKYASMALDIYQKTYQAVQEKRELNKQKDALEKYASMGKLAAGIVHEINNPLDGIIRYTNMLLSQSEENQISRDYLLEIKSGLNRIANITKSLLEFSHLVNSKSHQAKNYIEIASLIDDSLDIMAKTKENNVKVVKKYADALPKILDLGLQHVFVNIIRNAFEAMPGGGELNISSIKDNGTIKINFKDSGCGISEELKENIFEPFFTTKVSERKGTGLGLAMCKEIMDKYEGKIEFQSVPQKGTIFSVSIPKKFMENV